MKVFTVKVDSRFVGGTQVVDNEVNLRDVIMGYLDGLTLLSASMGDEPVTITIKGGDVIEDATLTITAEDMAQETFDALPEFEGIR